jgi:hypothetical protein
MHIQTNHLETSPRLPKLDLPVVVSENYRVSILGFSYTDSPNRDMSESMLGGLELAPTQGIQERALLSPDFMSNYEQSHG